MNGVKEVNYEVKIFIVGMNNLFIIVEFEFVLDILIEELIDFSEEVFSILDLEMLNKLDEGNNNNSNNNNNNNGLNNLNNNNNNLNSGNFLN